VETFLPFLFITVANWNRHIEQLIAINCSIISTFFVLRFLCTLSYFAAFTANESTEFLAFFTIPHCSINEDSLFLRDNNWRGWRWFNNILVTSHSYKVRYLFRCIPFGLITPIPKPFPSDSLSISTPSAINYSQTIEIADTPSVTNQTASNPPTIYWLPIMWWHEVHNNIYLIRWNLFI
jgi:hypothetical protein